jgi:hypothetical protein
VGQLGLVDHTDRAAAGLKPDGAPGLAVDVHGVRGSAPIIPGGPPAQARPAQAGIPC